MKKIPTLFVTAAILLGAIILPAAAVLVGTEFWKAEALPNDNYHKYFGTLDTHGYTLAQNPGCSDRLGNEPTAVEVLDPVLNRNVWRIDKPVRRKRAEFARTNGTLNSFVPKDGDDMYIGYHWKMFSDPVLKSGLFVFQWKSVSTNTQDYPVYAMWNGSHLTFSMVGPGYNLGGSISNFTTQICSIPVQPNTWVSLVIHIKASTIGNQADPGSGLVELWFNGQKQVLTNTNGPGAGVTLSTDNTTAYGKTWDTNGNTMKWGSYNSGACAVMTQTSYDHLTIARTFAYADPGPIQ